MSNQRNCGRPKVEPLGFTTAEEAQAWLEGASASGFVCGIHGVARIEGNVPGALGPLLSADVALDQGRGATLRFDGTWTAWTVTETDGTDCRYIDEARVTLIGGQSTRCTWRVYWCPVLRDDGVSVLEPFAARMLRAKES